MEELWILDVPSRRWERVEMSADPSALISEACWSRDNRHLVVMKFFRDGTSSYWYVALDGSTAEQLVARGKALSGTFACDFSPDNSQIVYTHRVGGFSQLFALDLATRRERQVTTSASHKYHATWSPDGRWLVYNRGNGGSSLWRLTLGPAS